MTSRQTFIAFAIYGLLLAGGLGVVEATAEEIAITGGRAYVSGEVVVENATILIKDGKIEGVTQAGDVPAGYRVIDASGQWVTVGLMVADSNIGLVEVSSSAGIVDHRVSSSEKSPFAYDVSWALNPDSTIIPITRIEGITRAATGFSGGGSMWRGQGAIIHLGDGPDMLVKPRAYLGLDVSASSADSEGGSRAVLWHKVIQKLNAARPENASSSEDASSDQASEDAKEEKKSDKNKKPDPEKEALNRLFSGEALLIVQAHRVSDIRNVIKLKADYGIEIVLSGASEAWRVAEELAAADIAVIVDATSNLPGNFDQLAATQANAARLHAAGVKIAFNGDETHNARLMPQKAGNAVANGLPWAAAFDAMTKNPAEIFGISESYGTLSKGKDADIVVWSGDPIEVTSAPNHVLIKGTPIELVSRQTKLRDRYLTLKPHPQVKD